MLLCVLPTARAVAVRRSALAVAEHGPLVGVVVSSRATPELVRVVVDVPELGEIDAVAPLDVHPGAGAEVRLVVEATRLAVIPEG